MRLLVGTDFSEQAVQAADAAAALANAWNESIVLVHVNDRTGFEEFSPRVMGEIVAAAERNLKAEAKRLRDTGVTVQEELMSGAAYECLVDRANPQTVRMVVVSSHSRTVAGRWLLGSVSERVAETSHVPTLVVHNADPIEDWLAGRRPLRVVVACDLTAASDGALRYVRTLQKLGPCEVTIGYVDSPLEERLRLGLKGPVSLTANDPEVQAVIERDLRRKVTDVLGESPREILVEPNLGRPDFALAHIATSRAADLVITGTHQRHGTARWWHTSFSRGLLHNCRTNVLCVPVAAENRATLHPVSRVLVATDLSKLGNSAVAQAFNLSRPGGKVQLVHVLGPNELPNPLIGGHLEKKRPTKKGWLKLKKDLEAKLEELVPADAAENGISHAVEIVEDRDPGRAIVQAAERFGADAICVATHGHTGVVATLMGSVAQSVVKHAKRPVHLVRAQKE